MTNAANKPIIGDLTISTEEIALVQGLLSFCQRIAGESIAAAEPGSEAARIAAHTASLAASLLAKIDASEAAARAEAAQATELEKLEASSTAEYEEGETWHGIPINP